MSPECVQNGSRMGPGSRTPEGIQNGSRMGPEGIQNVAYVRECMKIYDNVRKCTGMYEIV